MATVNPKQTVPIVVRIDVDSLESAYLQLLREAETKRGALDTATAYNAKLTAYDKAHPLDVATGEKEKSPFKSRYSETQPRSVMLGNAKAAEEKAGDEYKDAIDRVQAQALVTFPTIASDLRK